MKKLKKRLHPAYIWLRYHFAIAGPQRIAASRQQIAATWKWIRQVIHSLRQRRREKRLTVAVDISSFWEPLTGIGWYLYRLLEHLADRDDVRLRLYGPFLIDGEPYPQAVVPPPEGPALEVVAYRIPDQLLVSVGFLQRWMQKTRPLWIAADRNRVVFAPNYVPPRAFFLSRGKRVATVHDLGFVKVPWTLQQATLEELTAKLGRTFRGAAHIVTPSRAVRQEIIEAGYAAAERITAVHHGPGQLSTTPAGEPPPGCPERFALHVGTIEPRKNIIILLEAWEQLNREGVTLPLVLCGRYGWKSDDLKAKIETAQKEGWARHFGYVENSQLAALYETATLVVFPSLYEGFGLPAVEALWAGAPLLASDIPVLREVAADAAHYAASGNSEEWVLKVRLLAENDQLRADLAHRGRERAAVFDWQRAAEETLEVWRGVTK